MIIVNRSFSWYTRSTIPEPGGVFMKISQTKDIRTANSLTIIRHILDKKEISRARISEDTGLNKATVSTIVKDWMNLKLWVMN